MQFIRSWTIFCIISRLSQSFAWNFIKNRPTIARKFRNTVGIALVGALSFVLPLQADDSRLIGDIPTSGLFFKDSLKVTAFEDPKIKGVTLYLSDFDRPLTEKLAKDFFDDPSSSSLTCAQTGPIILDKNKINTSPEGEEVFEASRSLFFKKIRVNRIYDEKTNTVLYTSYSTRLDKGSDSNKARFKSSLCAVHIN